MTYGIQKRKSEREMLLELLYVRIEKVPEQMNSFVFRCGGFDEA